MGHKVETYSDRSDPHYKYNLKCVQIDDDENCVETILVEIHADNEDSFIDKNVTLTMYKIAEGSGVSDE